MWEKKIRPKWKKERYLGSTEHQPALPKETPCMKVQGKKSVLLRMVL